MIRAAIYIRTGVADAENCRRQKESCLKLAHQEGLEVVDVYLDEAGGIRRELPALGLLAEESSQRGITVVIIAHPDRLGRSLSEMKRHAMALRRRGLEIKIADGSPL